MKILYIMSSYNIYGGTPKKTLDLVKYFKEDVTLYVYHNVCREFKPDFEATGAKIYEGFYGRNIYKHLLKLNKVVKDEKIDIIQTQFTMGEVLGYFVKVNNPHVKLIVAFVGLENLGKLKKWVVNKVYKRVDAFIYISKFVKHKKENEYSILIDKKSVIIYNGTEKRVINKKYKTVLNSKSILCVSSLIPLKNIEILISAMKVLQEKTDINLYIAGEGNYRSKLERLVSSNGLGDRIYFLGNQRGIGNLLDQCDIFVHPSYKEGFGIAVAEAMHAKKPIIVSNAGALPELIENEKTGLIVDPFDAEAWASAIIRLKKDKSLADSLATNANIKAERDFSVLKFTENYEKFYKTLID